MSSVIPLLKALPLDESAKELAYIPDRNKITDNIGVFKIPVLGSRIICLERCVYNVMMSIDNLSPDLNLDRMRLLAQMKIGIQNQQLTAVQFLAVKQDRTYRYGYSGGVALFHSVAHSKKYVDSLIEKLESMEKGAQQGIEAEGPFDDGIWYYGLYDKQTGQSVYAKQAVYTTGMTGLKEEIVIADLISEYVKEMRPDPVPAAAVSAPVASIPPASMKIARCCGLPINADEVDIRSDTPEGFCGHYRRSIGKKIEKRIFFLDSATESTKRYLIGDYWIGIPNDRKYVDHYYETMAKIMREKENQKINVEGVVFVDRSLDWTRLISLLKAENVPVDFIN